MAPTLMTVFFKFLDQFSEQSVASVFEAEALLDSEIKVGFQRDKRDL